MSTTTLQKPQDHADSRDRQDDQTDLVEPREKQMRETVRAEAQALIEHAEMSVKGISRVDTQSFRSFMSEAGLARGGFEKHEDKMRILLEDLRKIIPDIIREAMQMIPECERELNDAVSKGWIGQERKEKVMLILTDPTTSWHQKRKKIGQIRSVYIRNWERAYADETVIKEKMKQLRLSGDDHPSLKGILNAGLRNKSLPERRADLDAALAFILATEKSMKDLHTKANVMLQAAVARGILSTKKVGTWMKRIFESAHDRRTIERFLSGEGSGSLPELMEQWALAARRFQAIEQRCRAQDSAPRTFHFVKMDVFLGWHFDRRMSYLEEAEASFVDVTKEHPKILDLRRELAAQDWQSADALMAELKRDGNLSEEDRKKLASMEAYLHEHRPLQQEKHAAPENSDGRQECLRAYDNVRMAIALLPPSLQSLYVHTIECDESLDTFFCLCAVMYNRVWCHDNGHLTDHKEVLLEEQTMDDTRVVVKEGHREKGLENNDLETFGHPAVRTYEHGETGPQILHCESDGFGSLLSTLKEQRGNAVFKYWTTLLPGSIEYGLHKAIVEHIHPLLKSNLRTLKANRIPFHLGEKPALTS